MTRLIDADALIKALDIGDLPIRLTYEINNAPTVDAVPVKHGKWLPENRTMDAYWVCSCCGFPSEAHGAFKIYKYCPNCGARMDEE
jgi:transcription initiation factor IIE alpha subunit